MPDPFEFDKWALERRWSLNSILYEMSFRIVDLTHQRTQASAWLMAKGKGATPAGRVELHFLGVPGQPFALSRATNANDQGEWDYQEEWPLMAATGDIAFGYITVVARDAASGDTDVSTISAAYWVA